MNQKKAKALRRLARAASVGKPARRLILKPVGKRDGTLTGMVINDPQSTRGVYRRLKREAR